MMTEDPMAPVLGVKVVMPGAGVTVKLAAAPDCPPTVTITGAFPMVTPLGTGAVILVPDHTEGLASIPLNFTVLPLKGAERKLLPAITMDELIAPALGVKLVMAGTPVARGKVTCESKLPFNVPSTSSSPLNVVVEVDVRLTPTHR